MFRKALLTAALLLGSLVGAQAQCVGVGGVNAAPWPGMNCQMPPTIPSFFATGIGLVPAASATDIACLPGNATNIVRVTKVRVAGTAGTLVTVPVTIAKRAAANTSGTLATSTALPVASRFDSTSTAPVSVPLAWTANPTITDSSPLLVDSANVTFNTTSTTVAGAGGLVFDWRSLTTAAPVLRGVAQNLCVNLNAVSVSSGVLNVNFEWTETAQ